MSRSKKSTDPSMFRFMCITSDNHNYHKDFLSKEEALQYAEEIDNSSIEWYGVYELVPYLDYLVTIVSKRLIPHNNVIYINSKNSKNSTRKRSDSSLTV